eukprot:1911349-Amphidinium_carterae.1
MHMHMLRSPTFNSTAEHSFVSQTAPSSMMALCGVSHFFKALPRQQWGTNVTKRNPSNKSRQPASNISLQYIKPVVCAVWGFRKQESTRISKRISALYSKGSKPSSAMAASKRIFPKLGIRGEKDTVHESVRQAKGNVALRPDLWL